MSTGDDELESKVGQFIYTMVMYERLREFLMERVRGRGRLSFRIELGKDRLGRQVMMDVAVSTVLPPPGKLNVPAGEPEPTGRAAQNLALICLTNDKLENPDSEKVAKGLEEVLVSSFKWWHDYLGERDNMNLETWRITNLYITAGDFAGFLLEVPVDSIIVPERKKVVPPDEMVSKLSKLLEILAPIGVKPIVGQAGLYELVYGYERLAAAKLRGRRTIKARLHTVTDEEADLLWNQDYETMQQIMNARLV